MVNGVLKHEPTSVDAGDHTLVRVEGLAKAFGPTQAVRDATLALHAGEVHALVGENGSGKSTLVKVLAGVHRPDSGVVEIDGTAAGAPANPRAALRSGISTVFQEVLVVEGRSVLENVWLGNEGFLRAVVDEATMRAQASAALTALLGRPLPLELPAGALSLSDRQACCIARSLVREPRVLLLDEATSALDVATRERLFALLRERAAAGLGIVLISHRMDEITDLADRVTVMRSGETVATLPRAEATAAELVRLMTGAEHLTGSDEQLAGDRARRDPGSVVLHARDVTLRPGRPPVSLEVRRGELVGLAGLEGHGQDAFLRVLAGHIPAPGAVEVDGVVLRGAHDAARVGIAYVPRERRAESLFASKSVVENFALATMAADVRRGLLWPRRSRARLRAYVDRLRIVLGDPGDRITMLSGGNQQKVVIARWLAAEPEVLLLNDPTRGVDLGAKRDLYALLRELVETGVAVVMLSTEVDEHVELMDRVLVFREYAVAAELRGQGLTRETLVASFFGGRDDG